MRLRKVGGKKTCSKCGKPKESSRGKQRYCKACHAANMRKNRPKHSSLTNEQRKKANCRSYVNVYIRRGRIKKLPCEKCGDINSQMHHENYDKPLEVVWLCRKHHLELHNTLMPTNQIMSGQSPNNQNSKNNESQYADNLAINGGNVFAEQVQNQIENSNDNKNDK